MKTKGFKAFLSLLIAFVMAGGLFGSSGSVLAADGSFTVKGSSDSGYVDEQSFTVDGKVAYCGEQKRDVFPNPGPATYNKVFTTKEDYYVNSQGNNQSFWWLDNDNYWDQIKAVLYAGYPHNKAGIGATEQDTQVAVWHYTNSFNSSSTGWNANVEKLIAWAENPDNTVPSSAVLSFYQKDDDGQLWQSMFSLTVNDDEPSSTPSITNTTAKANGTAGKIEVEEGSDIKITDEVTLKDLDTSKKYQLKSKLIKDGDNPVEEITTVVEGDTVTVTFAAVKEAGVYSVITELWEEGGDAAISTHNGKLDDAAETVTVIVKEEEPTPTPTTTPTPTPTSTPTPTPTPTTEPDKRSPSIGTTVTADDVEASSKEEARLTYEQVQEKVQVVDTISYKGLIAGVEYTVKGTLVEVGEDGKVVDEEGVASETGTFTPESEDGTCELDFGKVKLKPYAKYVVFEEVYAVEGDDKATEDSHEDTTHEDLTDKAQTILTEDEEGHVLGEREEPVEYNGELSTTVSAGGKSGTAAAEASLTAAEASAVTTVTDTITYTGMQGGDTYAVTGRLMRVTGSTAVLVKSVTTNLKADDSGSGTWTMTFSDIKLAPGAKYVVYESAANTDEAKADDTAEHADIDDKAQTLVIGTTTPTPTKSATSPKTGESPRSALPMALFMVVALAAATKLIRRKA